MIIVYDKNMKKQAILENAFQVGYEQKLNQLWTAFFSLPADDPKAQFCQPLNYVEIFDTDERVELFRITPQVLNKSTEQVINYQCEHVLATLMDDVLFQYHEIGGTGVNTTTVINYVLSKQSNWVLDVNQFSRQFLYNWENENLLAALFSIPKPFIEPYRWEYDTTVYPWKISLRAISEEVNSYVRYRKNMRAITKEEDPTDLCTRLYCLGYGEGVNQLGIKSVNNGLPYIDGTTQQQYGIISRVFVDRRFESEETLFARGQALLNELQVPRISYSVNAAEIDKITNDPVDKFEVGTYTRVIDTELGINFKALVLSKRKNDIKANPSDCQLEIANRPRDISGSIAELADRTRINEVYSQGATNLNTYNFVDNCDPQNPAIFKLYIPEETVRINKLTLSYQTESFRAFSQAIEGGGAFTDTTSSGGGVVDSTSSGGGVAKSSGSGGGTSTSTASGGGSFQTVSFDEKGSVNFSKPLDSFKSFIRTDGAHTHTGQTSFTIPTAGSPDHYHDYRSMASSGSHFHTIFDFRLNFDVPNHTHAVSTPDHTHSINIPNHTHGINIPSHTHSVSIPNHTHQIQYGIFQGPTPTALTLQVDNNLVSGAQTFANDIDIVPYLSKDSGGRIIRGWHEIKITPNNLGRITADVVVQLFVQSRGGGDF
jgi:phage minor structural protein